MSGDAKYFQTTKKGEIRELQDDLNSVNKEKIKEAVKKVIAAMTVGKDVSMLFSDVIKSMGTDNIELKKLVYLYIINYARSQPEKAILVVNMFQKDATNHPNPLVRALAIRTMGCIRVDKITEYLCDPLNISLKDNDPYVRKTAAICVAKLYDINSELVEERGFIDLLRGMLSDVNPMVVANAVASLTEISESSGKDYFKIDNQTLSKLLTALNECTEWGRVFILDALAKFESKKSNIDQARDICDRVVPQLAHANSAVVMAAVKVVIKFLGFLTKKEDIEKFCKKLAPPLVTLLSSPPEIQYVALRNIDLIVQKYPKILQNDIRIFFVKFNDAVYVKMQKLEILIKLTTRKNIDQVLMEFKEYAQEVDVEFVRRAVRAIGRIAIKLDSAAEKCVHVLSELVKTKINYVVQESVIVIKDIFRRYPKKYEKIIVTLCDNLESLDEPDAKSSMIWIIGEYAERIVDAGQRLEHFIESFNEENSVVQLQLLTATVKLFLKKPDKAKKIVQKVLDLATENSDNPDLRDRGYVYWRLLSTDPAAARAVVLAERPIISSETFSLPEKFLNELLNNISTLSSVYHRAPNEFVRGLNTVVFKQYDKDEESETESESTESEDNSNESDKESSSETDENEQKEKYSKKKHSKKNIKKKKEKIKKKIDTIPIPEPINNAPIPEPVIKKEPETDLLGDLFGNNNQSIQQSQQQQQQQKSDDFDIFGMLGGSGGDNNNVNNNNKDNYNGPELKQVSNANGLQIEVGYKNEMGEPFMVFKFCNNGNANIERIDIKLNKNYLGIQPSQNTLNIGGEISIGNTRIVNLKLILKSEPIQKKPLDTKVQVAIRCIRTGSGKPPVNMFADEIPPKIFFIINEMERPIFLQSWKNQDMQSITNQVKQAGTTNENEVKNMFNNINCKFIAERTINNKGKAIYFATNLKNVSILIEISIANNGACRVVTKSQNKYLSFVVCQTALQMMS